MRGLHHYHRPSQGLLGACRAAGDRVILELRGGHGLVVIRGVSICAYMFVARWTWRSIIMTVRISA